MSDLQVVLTSEERDCLAELLKESLKNTLLEEHRTRAPAYRDHVVRREQLIRSVLAKLQPVNA
jgi:hypothetical protein